MKAFVLPHGRAALLAFLDEHSGDRLTVTVDKYRPKRSLEQNNLSFKFYELAGEHMGETADYVRRYCKLTFGVPILRADDAEYDAYCRRAIDPFSYEEQLENMKYTPVTRLMNKSQMAQFIQDVQIHFAREGIVLEAA